MFYAWGSWGMDRLFGGWNSAMTTLLLFMTASSTHHLIPSSSPSAYRMELSILFVTEDIYLSISNSKISVVVTQSVNETNDTRFVIYRYNDIAKTYHLVALTGSMTDLFSSVGRKTAYINTVYEEVINTTDVYYLGIVTNANGIAILGSTSTLTNNEPYVNGFIDNIVNFKIDDLKTLYSISSSETGYKVNSSSDAYYLRLLSNSNTNI